MEDWRKVLPNGKFFRTESSSERKVLPRKLLPWKVLPRIVLPRKLLPQNIFKITEFWGVTRITPAKPEISFYYLKRNFENVCNITIIKKPRDSI